MLGKLHDVLPSKEPCGHNKHIEDECQTLSQGGKIYSGETGESALPCLGWQALVCALESIWFCPPEQLWCQDQALQFLEQLAFGDFFQLRPIVL